MSLYNFNSFEGENEFDFSNTEENKNIILIGGKNGAGKTSLFTAIKVALYGPLAFGYMSINPHYIARIKDYINTKAFQQDKVEARVQLTISLIVEREYREYELTREWDYSQQKLIEHFSIKENGKILDDQKLAYFQNYMQGMIPPDLFDFFLFDGEEVGTIFSTSTYNKYVQNAIYTLCGLDTFELIRKYTAGYAGRVIDDDGEPVATEYERLKQEVDILVNAKKAIDQNLANDQSELERVEVELMDLNASFKKSGGITFKERNRLMADYEEAEKEKAETTAKIKLYVEELMPFFIMREFNEKVKRQLDLEEKNQIYRYVQQKLNKEKIISALNDKAKKESVEQMMNIILAQFKPADGSENAEPIHDLSKEETGRINAVIASVEGFNADDMISTIEQKRKSLEITAEINKKIKNSMLEEDAAKYIENENILLRKQGDINKRIYEAREQIEAKSKEIELMTAQRDKARLTLQSNALNQHVLELSTGLTNMMNKLLENKWIAIREKLENLIIENLKSIYRKDNLITHIEIGDDFQMNLYQDAVYSSVELAHLLKNLGQEDFALTIGKRGQRLLYETYKVDSWKALSRVMKKQKENEISLYKKIDLDRLSKGERQIFVLSLYWAIIELSGKDIPFIIDTPYARIDATHRKEISQKFFPSISKQVIILSTDEEINEEYYQIIKPHIAKEYLLINDESQNKTSVEDHYFFGE